MTAVDRTYTYIVKSFDAPRLDAVAFSEAMHYLAMPLWQSLHEKGLIATVQALREDRDIHTVLGATSRYRIKPRMNKNELIRTLCLGRQFTGDPPPRGV